MKVVKVDESNIAAAGAVHAESWRASHGFCAPEFVEAHTAETQANYLLDEILQGKDVYMLLDPDPVGVVSVSGDVIGNLYVLPELWGRGYGSALLKYALRRCQADAKLWVLSSNNRARHLYKHFGFWETGERKSLGSGLEEIEMRYSRLKQIRQAEAESHIAAYNSYILYQPGSWLSRPVKALRDLLPLYAESHGMRVLDLGSGVGRNAIAAARALPGCIVECVDILPMAIEKLHENAREMGVGERITGIGAPVDSFPIEGEGYDLILACSVLEHLDSRASSLKKLAQIHRGIRPGGALVIVMNTGVREWDLETGETLPPQFEVNLPPEEVRALLHETFRGWELLTDTLTHQEYDVPRGERTAVISSEVVTFAARRPI